MEKKTNKKQTKTRREDVSPKDALVILPLDQTFILNTYPMPAFRSSLILLNNFFVPTEQLKGGKLTQREKKEKELRASLN